MRRHETVLGISNTKDSGAALICDGRIVAAANEERFDRTKLSRCFPAKSIRYVLEEAGARVDDVDVVVSGAWAGLDANEMLPAYVDDVAYNVAREPGSRALIEQRVKVTLERDGAFRDELVRKVEHLRLRDRLVFADHHRAHAASAYYGSPYDEALVVVMDARGDFKSCSTYVGRGAELQMVDAVSDLNSPGVVYSFVTRLLGFTPDRHEGKVTGLAAHGDAEATRHVFEQMVSIDADGRIRANIGERFSPFMTARLPHVERQLEAHSREDIAAGVQAWLEDLVVEYVGRQLELHGLSTVCLAGGVFANVKVNQRIREMEGVERIYIHQHMGDGGIALGGGLDVLHRRGGALEQRLGDVYLGPDHSDVRLRAALRRLQGRLAIRELADVASSTARMLAAGKVVGWYHGRMEYGPRALCHRSILVAATDASINDRLNARLSRTEFMPFAPVTLEEHAADCYVGWQRDHVASRSMTMCYPCTPTMAELSPAVVHVDGTARPQVVGPQDDPLTHELLSRYHELTGIPSLVNTSFNNHEEPIVNTPEHALRSLLRGNVDVLVAGGYAIARVEEARGVLPLLAA